MLILGSAALFDLFLLFLEPEFSSALKVTAPGRHVPFGHYFVSFSASAASPSKSTACAVFGCVGCTAFIDLFTDPRSSYFVTSRGPVKMLSVAVAIGIL